MDSIWEMFGFYIFSTNYETEGETLGNWALLGISIAIMIYLVYVIIHPEKF